MHVYARARANYKLTGPYTLAPLSCYANNIERSVSIQSLLGEFDGRARPTFADTEEKVCPREGKQKSAGTLNRRLFMHPVILALARE